MSVRRRSSILTGVHALAALALAALALAVGCNGSGDSRSKGEPPRSATVDAGRLVPDADMPMSPLYLRLPDPKAKAPFWLSSTGLYEDIASKTISADAIELEPAFPLWTDGALKRRWLILPAGEQIDNGDPNHWRFPVGTLAFKEFRNAERRLETRLIARTGPGDDDFWMGAFVWDEQESDARFTPKGAQNVLATEHDVPTTRQCWTCHRGDSARFLGFSAIQLPQLDPGLLSDRHLRARLTGNSVEIATLGYLHGNCAHCHNPSGSARPDTDLNMRLAIEDRDPRKSQTYITTVGIALQNFAAEEATLRVVPGRPEHSAVLLRMQQRGVDAQMPPLGTEHPDPNGLALVRAWILAIERD